MDSQEYFKPYSTRFEFCSICQCLYTLQGRKQHLNTKHLPLKTLCHR